ncbi:Dal81p KNAG_0M02460 [Huiozyma naganishii CBS 8797]|uniref:Xylanolytic transcriptional activator regulatory domain-containing protein n=1 Tax=Huiozyma naganishii (strain ATCC MYA-139 / BCRC 22969 / CBS 8797 / KCTC 17520 / NBRC 10181 / NCYC 3082 / Yp74L-3) TaxID=1071383 RepID=J7SAW0_HUIN7|nr:hypothetical protein KNAG_0M02460 [Kazachstania naganishii CBS 8797]CCK73099.1 hypothetical protein KNAG_0M02460 [Kazachstania naganishii CBS 8797]
MSKDLSNQWGEGSGSHSAGDELQGAQQQQAAAGAVGYTGEPTDKEANPNNELLNFADNYSALIQNLAREHNPDNTGGDSVEKSTAGNTNMRENLDMLLQHYQQMVDKSAPEDSDPRTTGNEEIRSSSEPTACLNCVENGTKCVFVPDLGVCLECETKRLSCSLSNGKLPLGKRERPNTNDSKPQRTQSQQKRKKGNPSGGDNSDDQGKNQQYSNFLQTLYNSMSPGQTNRGFEKGSPTNETPTMAVPPQNERYTPAIQSQQDNNQSQRNPLPQQMTQYPRSSFYVGATSFYDANILNHAKLNTMDQIQIAKSMSLRKVAPNVTFLLRDDFDESMYISQEQEVDAVERLVYPHGRILIEIFFQLIHPYFPILHERVFLEKYNRSYRELTAPLLACIYSLALQWWDFHPKLIGFTKPLIVEKLNDIAFKTFFNRISRPKLSMVQTGLLLLQCRSESPDNWVLCSNLVALSEELGLGVDCQKWKLPKWEKDLRKRLAWAVWAQDKWTAMVEGRHSHLILGRNWMVNVLKRDDFPTKSPTIELASSLQPSNSMTSGLSMFDMNQTAEDYKNGTLMFQQMVALSIIVGEIMDTFYTQGAIHVNTSIEQVLKLAKPLQLKLREWYHSLPQQLSMGKFSPKKFNANATLTLSYFAAEITLHRKIISTLDASTPRELVQVCRTAAKTRLVAAIEFVRDLKSEHVNSFWYPNSTGNFMLIGTFATLLYVTSGNKDEALVFRDLLRNYIWILKVGYKSFEKLRNALENMHMLLAQIPGLLTDELPQDFVPPKSRSQMFRAQQQMLNSYPSASPAITDQGSASPLTGQPRSNVATDVLQSMSNLQSNSPLNSLPDRSPHQNVSGPINQMSPHSATKTPTQGNLNVTPGDAVNGPTYTVDREEDTRSVTSAQATPYLHYSPNQRSQISSSNNTPRNESTNNFDFRDKSGTTMTPRNVAGKSPLVKSTTNTERPDGSEKDEIYPQDGDFDANTNN